MATTQGRARLAYQLATRDLLRSTWAPNNTSIIAAALVSTLIRATYDGRPPPAYGGNVNTVFVAVHRGGRSNSDKNSLDETYGLNITLTKRFPGPFDKIGDAAMNVTAVGLEDTADSIRAFMHMNYPIMNAANVYIQVYATNAGLSEIYGFCEPLIFQGGDETPQLVHGEWFHAASDSSECGLAMALRFGTARLVQPNSNLN